MITTLALLVVNLIIIKQVNYLQQVNNPHNVKQNTMEKRKIESAAELVNALELGVGVLNIYDELVTLQSIFVFYARYKEASLGDDIIDGVFRYSEPVEVVELWGSSLIVWFKDKQEQHTHKQTQIIQNGEIIWTKTEKI